MYKMSKTPLTSWGIAVKTELMKNGKTQEWLIQEIKKQTDNYVDSSNIYKVLYGKLNSKVLINIINNILHINPKTQKKG